MAKLFGVDIAAEIHKAISPGLLEGTLTRITYGERDDADLTSGLEESTATYSFRGIISNYSVSQIDGVRILRGDKKVMIIGGSLPAGIVAEPNDKVAIDGETDLTIVTLEKRDPASAAYVYQARG